MAVVPGEVSFGPVTITTSAHIDTFVVKYSPSGEVRWAIQSEGQDGSSETFPPYGGGGLGIGADGAVFIAGNSYGEVRLGATTLTGRIGGVFAARILDPDSLRLPLLSVTRTGGDLQIRWPAAPGGFVLESANALPAAAWNAVPAAPILEGDQNVVTNAFTSSLKFFRLRKP